MTSELDKAEQAPGAKAVAYPGVSDAIERLREAAHRDEAVTTSVRAQDLRNALATLAAKEAECEALRKKLTQCENMHLPEATSAAVLGHMRCMEAFQSVQERCLVAEAKLKRMEIALKLAEEYAETEKGYPTELSKEIALLRSLASEDSAE